MFEVLNISKKTITIGGVKIAPMQSHIFNSATLSSSTLDKINSLASLGLIKILPVATVTEPEQVEKKSSKKSK